MASLPNSPLISFFFFFSSILVQTCHQTLITPITKDNSTNLYTLLVDLQTPLQPSKLHLDLGSYLPFYDCGRHNKSSSSYQPVYSNSSLCNNLDTGFGSCSPPVCSNDKCTFSLENPITRKIAIFSEVRIDKFALRGSDPVFDLVFSCTNHNEYSKIYRGLAKGSTGLAALGRSNFSLPAQLSRSFSSPQIFAICLPSNSSGFALFNSPGPYYFSPRIEISKLLIYTQLIVGTRGADTQIYYWHKSPDYYLPLTSINVHDRVVALNQTLLAIDEIGRGGVKISTSVPYTVLQSSIYKALTDAFVQESAALNLTVIPPVKPFSVCYSTDKIASTRLGPAVPTVDLVLEKKIIFWRIYGSNSMVRVENGWCLGMVDGGVNPRTSIVIGGHQFEDNLVQFDLQRGRLGFTSSLLFYNTTCANFNLDSANN